MATYSINGQDYVLPDNLPDDQRNSILSGIISKASPTSGAGAANTAAPAATQEPAPTKPKQAPSSFNPAPAQDQKKGWFGTIDPDTLQHNADWVRSAEYLYKSAHPGQPIPSAKDLAEFGLDTMGWFNYNTPSMAVDAYRLKQASPEEKKAFLYLMDTYDKLEMSWGGVGRFIKGAATDPINYVGLSTLGLGIAGGQATKLASKEALKQMLRAGIQFGIENAIQAGVQDSIKQGVEIEVGKKSEFEYGRLAKEAGIGFGAGAVLGGAADALGTALRPAAKGAEKAAEAAPTPGATTLAANVTKAVPEAPEAAAAPATTKLAPTGRLNPDGTPELGPVLPADANGVKRGAIPEAPAAAAKVVDTTAPIVDNNPIVQAIKEVTEKNGMRFTPSGDLASDVAKPATDAILAMKPDEAKPLIEGVRQALLHGEENSTLRNAVSDATEKLLAQVDDLSKQIANAPNQAAKDALYEQRSQVQRLVDIVKPLDTEVSSTTGKDLAFRVGKTNTGAFREETVDKILEAQGLTRETASAQTIREAEDQFAAKLAERMDIADKQPEIMSLKEKVDQAFIDGETDKALSLHAELVEKRAALLEAQGGKEGPGAINKIINGLNEYVISTVFTTKTVIINTIPSLLKTFYRPALDAFMRGPLDSASWRMAGAQYAVMGTNIDTAFKAAMAAYRYEKGLLSSDFSKYIEHDPVFAKWYGGGILRFFPRMLGATDEFFQQITYRGYVAAEATGLGLREAERRGLKGDAADQLVKSIVEKHLDKAFSEHSGVGALDLLRKEGISRGMSGDKLTEWMKLELDKNHDLFKTATNEAGLNYSNDLLFKREFSGEDGASRIAKGYEQFVNKQPIMRLMGQLFFRTPVRVFEEGFRLTPGLNIVSGAIAGQFLRDLRGANGVPAQLRAQGEAMLSVAIGGMVMNMYAQGKITGGGPDDWRQRRMLEDGKKWSPYTMKVGDHELNFRNLDPFSTPLKIMANALDRYANLQYRQAQGEYVNKSDYRNIAAYIAVAGKAIVDAIKDANLTDGLNELYKFGEDIMDPEAKEKALMKFLGQKAKLIVPNQIGKVQAVTADKPYINDPLSPDQYIKSAINPESNVPRRYDVLGRPQTVENPWAGILGVDVQLSRKAFTKEEKVIQELGKLAVNGNASWLPPYTTSYVKDWQGQDLRTMPTKDGKSTMYDRWQEYIAKSGMTDALYAFLTNSQGAPKGTASTPGAREEKARGIINDFRKAAFMRMLSDESGMKPLIDSKIREGKAKAGMFDVPWELHR